MGTLLTVTERQALLESHRGAKDPHARDRIKAVLAYDEGHASEEIAAILLIDKRTVYRYLRDYQKSQKLRHASGGKSSKLSQEQTNELLLHLREKIYLHVEEINEYVRQRYQIHYSVPGMTKWLHAHRFTYKKPHAVPAKLDAVKQAVFIEAYEELKADAAERNEVILFGDSVHPQHQTQMAYGWIPVGERKQLPTTGRQYRVNYIGAINLDTHDVLSFESERVNSNSIKLFLTSIRERYSDVSRIHLILDNAGYHKSRDMLDFAESLRIKIHYLPPYSPNLNPIERVWKIMRERVMYNRYYARFIDFTEAIRGFFSNINQYKPVLKTRITDNFQYIDTPLVTL